MTPAEIAKLEKTHKITVLAERIIAPGGRAVIAAVSANGRWGYEKEGRFWVVTDKIGREPLHFGASLKHARMITFDIDHPTPAPAAGPVRFVIE